MTWEAWASVLIMLASVVAMACGMAGSDLVLTAAMGLVLGLGILSPAEAARGFGNEGMLSVGVLFVVAAGTPPLLALCGGYRRARRRSWAAKLCKISTCPPAYP